MGKAMATAEVDGAGRTGSPVARILARAREPEFWPQYGVPLAFVVMCAYFAASSDVFLTVGNWGIILQQASITGTAAIGATIVLISGSIDISQGAVMAVSGLAAVELFNGHMPLMVVVLAAIVIGLAAGAFMGFLIVYLRIPSFIASLGVMLSVRGLAFVFTSGISVGLVSGISPQIVWLGQGRVGPIPVPVIIMVVLYGIFHLIMKQTAWGIRTAAVGSNSEAARLSGVKPAGIIFSTFMVAAALSAVTGLLLVGRLTSAAPDTATGVEFDILTAVVLGGASIYGGRGSVLRTLLGAVFIVTLYNGMLLLGVPSFYQQVASGLALVVALALNQLGTGARR